MATFARRLKAHLFVSTEWHVHAARLILLKAALVINIIIIIIIIIITEDGGALQIVATVTSNVQVAKEVWDQRTS